MMHQDHEGVKPVPTPPRDSSAPRASLDALLAFAWNAGVFVSADAMAVTGLTRSTAIDALDELIDLGLLHELPNARAVGEYSKGRPARRFELRAEAAVVIGVDAGRSHVTVTVADLRGTALGRLSVELDTDHDDPEARRSAVLDAIDRGLREAGRDRSSVVAVCVGVPAPVDSRGHSPRHRDGFWERMNPGLKEILEEWVPIVRIENDAALAAVAEGSTGAAIGCRDYVVLLAGDRFGAGVVIDGALLRGAHGGVGELVALDFVAGVESATGVGSRLTEWVREAAAAGEVPPRHPLADVPIERLTGQAVLELAREGDAWSRTFVERAGGMLARIAALFGSLYDPARVIVSGAVADGLDDVVDVARTRLPAEVDLPAPELVLSALGANSVATGAVAAALESARDRLLRLEPGALPLIRPSAPAGPNAT
ncbi:ROK family protein [Herbiconiux sp. CPCC 205763]|uniref:ROK family protein n=1 Tax=Herbiconiux aconitum TaxID=2970913 RepID=A0ABT2GW00_9MICO|nr:ROK family protein [Herbiconiux aconitum]MCS5719747.1 ROK family protein [Herbiconiux aconitum]